ncbi:MAG: hypothetical protein US83_C0010G0039 [Candidatus Falkowbacteria bacterium GW2011_GWC2_38_22]|uniref:Uncharacterized protein n=1 Tax=Candidatus Falkowbacteria bacterium GW2011_GWE1_38_31 TaxID=1618638 RepID=A0A0G0K470_9BACT|nr:MAG: hypothetical protein US73_C0005G0039 [Candidatus Falkowbacteria bacterium GW2011_GWF2_38_1205]KKQ61005.1 MAG: hypothetical protein US83_C0010G0039 [Candidatus Falkowbacteria bacterium GW2011_GWC2_38_22]KKQ63466.1 MAG: hypothetical protein US84_C0006G0069 [Candidatus Falkowbacteria bacterium GW2011_GWF1_38_22]KKQ65463.1 MAG: hypothetical protein US87_C0007G0039 [Candidatus Falkowbacteria bacterium GW2011_GWE2_38_254]KKQ70230.1 MAG: hypothetical protein US91_C0006G0069 [Candidatus Falkowb
MTFFKTVLAILIIFLNLINIIPVSAQDIGLDYAENLDLQVASETDPKQMMVEIVKYLMTFLGIIAVVIILYGGFKWMTAAGNQDSVEDAKKIIIAGAIGLVVILSAFAIITFIVNITNDAISGNI